MFDKYRGLLEEKLRENREQEGRSIYTRTQVLDILLDLWNVLEADKAEAGLDNTASDLTTEGLEDPVVL